MTIYLYSECALRAGQIAKPDHPDSFQWGSGSEAELIAQARERLAKRIDTRPGGAGDAFAHRCCRFVLEKFGLAHFDRATGEWEINEDEA